VANWQQQQRPAASSSQDEPSAARPPPATRCAGRPQPGPDAHRLRVQRQHLRGGVSAQQHTHRGVGGRLARVPGPPGPQGPRGGGAHHRPQAQHAFGEGAHPQVGAGGCWGCQVCEGRGGGGWRATSWPAAAGCCCVGAAMGGVWQAFPTFIMAGVPGGYTQEEGGGGRVDPAWCIPCGPVVRWPRGPAPTTPPARCPPCRSNGRVERLVDGTGEPMGPHRVWLQYAWIPGLAMSRALGDALAHQVFGSEGCRPQGWRRCQGKMPCELQRRRRGWVVK
jgi:hypothetical protein